MNEGGCSSAKPSRSAGSTGGSGGTAVGPTGCCDGEAGCTTCASALAAGPSMMTRARMRRKLFNPLTPCRRDLAKQKRRAMIAQTAKPAARTNFRGKSQAGKHFDAKLHRTRCMHRLYAVKGESNHRSENFLLTSSKRRP